MLPSEEQNILSSAVESGHAVVLTEVGKQILNSVKASDSADLPKAQFSKERDSKKIVTLTADEFFALSGSAADSHLNVSKYNTNSGKSAQNLKHDVKRAVIKRNIVNSEQQNHYLNCRVCIFSIS